MIRSIAIRDELKQVRTVEGLTDVFESVASMKIAKIRNRVIASKDFFAELWETYRGLRVNPKERLSGSHKKYPSKTVILAVTAEGKLGGDIDRQVVDAVVEAMKKAPDTDLIAIGAHGAQQLTEAGLIPREIIHVPEDDEQLDVSDIIELIKEHGQIQVYYQTYVSLRVQKVERIELASAVLELSDEADAENKEEGAAKVEIVSSKEYIFEPDINEVADYLESLMLGVALTQVIMESKLAQHASRFNAMHAAKNRAGDLAKEFGRMYHLAKRNESDERTKEVIKVMQVVGGAFNG